jgi:hypothetical protein
MFMLSTISGSTIPTPHIDDDSRILSFSMFRLRGDNDFESAIHVMSRSSDRITAAATTGPASGPRPASSTPQIKGPAFAPSLKLSPPENIKPAFSL